jgi:mannose-6-phosphate isomerase-like protein (cupin superfamily)
MLSVGEWEDDGHFTGWIAPLHIHHQDDELWYVLAGSLLFLLDGREIEAPAGSCTIVPRGVAHAYRNPGPQPARYLIVMPDRVRRLIDAIHVGTQDEQAMRALFAEHASTYLGWPAGE